MSFLGTALQRISEERGLNQSDIARQSGVSRSFISRVVAGEVQDFSDQHFVAVLKVFSADPKAQAEIIAARCIDALHPAKAADIAGAKLVGITVEPSGKAEKGEIEVAHLRGDVHLPKEVENAFEWLRSQCPVNSELQRHLVGYARLMGMK